MEAEKWKVTVLINPDNLSEKWCNPYDGGNAVESDSTPRSLMQSVHIMRIYTNSNQNQASWIF